MKTWGILLKSAYLVQSGQIANIPYISDCGLMLGLQQLQIALLFRFGRVLICDR